jgi:MFS family permease
LQAFLYNAVYFTFALVLGTFFGVPSALSGLYLIPLALGSLVGPLLLGRLFDSVGRRPMITVSYVGSGVLLVATAWLFSAGTLTAWTLAAAWAAIFFLASAGASAAYLTVSEIFPMEIRAMCIALFYAVGTSLGGIIGPVLFGALVETGDPGNVAMGYYLGAAVMILGGVAELVLGVEAAKRSLEDVATPLSAAPRQEQAEESGQPLATGERAVRGNGYGDGDASRQPPPRRRYTAPTLVDDPQREAHLGAVLQAVAGGPLERAELGHRVGAEEWGPGRLDAVVEHGVATGVLRTEGSLVRPRYTD